MPTIHCREQGERETALPKRDPLSGGQLCDHAEVVMGQSPAGSTCNISGEGMPLLNGPTEFGPHHPKPTQFTTDPRKMARFGDILFCVRGSTTGRMNWADQDYAIGRGIAAIRHRNDRYLQPFLRGVIEQYLPNLLVQATGSTFPNVSAQQLTTVPWPGLEPDEQRAIAQILGTLDDKIELNRRTNESLTEMAQALFKSWFVDFDPVCAKATVKNNAVQNSVTHNRPPESAYKGANSPESPREATAPMQQRTTWTVERACAYLEKLDSAVAALFPDSLIDSEFGKIPKGWKIKTLDALARNHKESISPYSKPNTLFEHYSIPAFDKNAQPKMEFGINIKSNKALVPEGAILLSKLNPNIPRVWIPNSPTVATQIASTEFLACLPRGGAGPGLLYCLFESHGFRQKLQSMVTGTSKSHQRVPPADLLNQKVLPGTHQIFMKFERLVAPLMKKCLAKRAELRNLQDLRDTLLPILISGEMRVDNWNELEAAT